MEEPAKNPLATLTDPPDWNMVGTRPEFYVQTSLPPAELRIRLFERTDFFSSGAGVARCVDTVSFSTTACDGVLLGVPDQALPAGDYILALERVGQPGCLSLSGMLVRPSEDLWPRVFERMDARWRTATAEPRRSPDSFLRRLWRRPMFSFTTTVYNTHPWFLGQLWDCLKAQSCADFEWVLLDNGSTSEATRSAVRAIAATDSRIRLFTVASNLHIIGGNRYTLQRARGAYIIPVDSDDLVYPYAVELIKTYVERHRSPDLLYSDEQKVSLLGTPREYLWRPEWSRLYALSTCPASHLMVFKRRMALRVNAYSAEYAQGSHDWDTALRFDEKNARTVHIPEVLYGWRMHGASAALNDASKKYLLDSQVAVVRESVARRGMSRHFNVESSGRALGYYHLVSRRTRHPGVIVNIVLPEVEEGDDAQLAHNLAMVEYADCWVRVHLRRPGACLRTLSRALALAPRQARGCEFIQYDEERQLLDRLSSQDDRCLLPPPNHQAIVYNRIRIADPGWLWDAVGTFELDASVGIVGGQIVDEQGRALHVGYVAGLGGFFSCPQAGDSYDGIYGQIERIRRCVAAVYGSFTMVRNDVFRAVGAFRGFDSTQGSFGVEYCARARKAGYRVAYTPRMAGTALFPMSATVHDPLIESEMLAQYGPELLQDCYYSKVCSGQPRSYGRVREAGETAVHLPVSSNDRA